MLCVSKAAKEIMSGKAILVDVRDPVSFAKEHPEVCTPNAFASVCVRPCVCDEFIFLYGEMWIFLEVGVHEKCK